MGSHLISSPCIPRGVIAAVPVHFAFVRKFGFYGLAAALLLGLAKPAQAEIYIYELPSGARMITDHALNNKQYKLVQTSARIKGMGALINSKNTQPLLVDTNAYDHLIQRFARTYVMEASLIKAVVHAESGFNPHAISVKGASGLMQLMPATAKRYGVVDIFDPIENIRAGTMYLRDLLKKYQNNHRLALAAYNAGEGAVARYRGIPPYAETQGYVRKVLGFKTRYASYDTKLKPKKTTVATLDASNS